jgi:hypothetical protein
MTGNEFGYLGEVFDRPAPAAQWLVDRAQSEDFFVRPDQKREDVIAEYKRSWVHAETTIAAFRPELERRPALRREPVFRDGRQLRCAPRHRAAAADRRASEHRHADLHLAE